jgi:hypothetical protein
MGRYETSDWTDRELGEAPGWGNDRPPGGAEVKLELDPGLAAVRYLYDNSRVDPKWTLVKDRGFTWWAHELVQRVWSEPGVDDAGIEVFRVFAATEVARGVTDPELAGKAIDTWNAQSVGSALVLDPDTGIVESITSMWAHDQTREWVARTFSVVAAIQVAEMHEHAPTLAPLFGGEAAVSEHPNAGARSEPDEMLDLLDLVMSAGAGPSAWAGSALEDALGQIRKLPGVGVATGDESGITVEVPYRQTSALIQMDTREVHSELGSGMLVRISLPGDAGPGPAWAAMRNRQELESMTRTHFLGSWIGSAQFATFVSFYPSLMARTKMGPLNVLLSSVNRVRWAASVSAEE